MTHQLFNSTLESWSSGYAGDKFHAALGDAPYGIAFMGKDWDTVRIRQTTKNQLHDYPPVGQRMTSVRLKARACCEPLTQNRGR